MEEEKEESVKWTRKTTVASVIKHKVVMRGSYQQTSVENAQVDLIQEIQVLQTVVLEQQILVVVVAVELISQDKVLVQMVDLELF